MSFNIGHILADMGIFALAIFGALAVMGLAALAVFIERLWAFARTRNRSLRFSRKAREHLEAHDYEALTELSEVEKGGLLAALLGAGSRTYTQKRHLKNKELGPVELARREMERKADAGSAKLRRGMNIVSSVGSIAPFTGLLGTVVGIIEAFNGIAAEGSGGLGAVSAGIAEALFVTAFGLVVAIPAVLAFNMLSSKADSLELAFDQARGEFIDHIEAHHEETRFEASQLAENHQSEEEKRAA